VYVQDGILEKFKLYTLTVQVRTNDNAVAGGRVWPDKNIKL